uniref:SREBP regulating gene protein n=1 Tax=Leersia perrieri TaxID=77586 RepID=A0A0D9XR49_9ORYZ
MQTTANAAGLPLLPRIVCAAFAFSAILPGLVAGIRKDIGLAAPIMCRSTTKEIDVLKLKVAKPVTSGTYRNVFDFCMGRCRHSSASVVHENAYASDFHHCFLLQQNSSGSADYGSGPRLDGINISIGSLQKYMRCKSGCFSSLGPDQPAQVVDEAPSNLNPGACLYMQMDERLTCDGNKWR